jgi:ribosomal protein S18 acetylase RimI-like enzyme
MKDIVMRRAKSTDLDRVWELWQLVVAQKVYFPYDETYSRSDMEQSWINLKNAVVVAELDGKILGAYILKPNQPAYGAHIVNAAYMVDTDARGLGLGSKLCAHSVEIAKELGYRGMQFNLVVSTNEAGIRAWKANGFEIIGTIPGGFYHVEKGYVDAYIFFRSLI